MIRAKGLFLVSILLKLCKKKHFKDKCPSVQRDWEEFIKNKEHSNDALIMLLYTIRKYVNAFSALLSECDLLCDFIRQHFLLISMRFLNVKVTICNF